MKLYHLAVIPFFQFLYVSSASATNFYIGANVGILDQEAKFKVLDSGLNPSVGINRPSDYDFPEGNELTYSLNIGYKLASDLFLEIGASRENEVEGNVRTQAAFSGQPDRAAYEEYRTDYIYAAFVGVWPVKNKWAITTRVGFSVWDMDYSQYSSDIPIEGLPTKGDLTADEPAGLDNVRVQKLSDNSAGLLVGAGLSFAFSKHLEGKFSIEKHFVDFAFTNLDVDYDSLSITMGVAYHF